MSWFTRSTPVETIKDAHIVHIEDVERRDGTVQRDRGYQITTATGAFAATAATVEEARQLVQLWSSYPDPAKQMASFNINASAFEWSESDDGTGFPF